MDTAALWDSPEFDDDPDEYEAFKDAPIDYHDYDWGVQ